MSTLELMNKTIEKLYAIDRIITAMQKRPHNYAGECLHSNEAHTLKMIAENEGISQAELSDRMLRTKGATSVMVDKLVSYGLVHRERENGNQRRYLLTLTEHGWTVHRAHMNYDESHARYAAQKLGMSAEELVDLNDKLDHIIQFYSTHYLDHGWPIQVDESGL